MAEVELGSSKVGEQVQSKLQVRGLKFMYRVFLKKNFFLTKVPDPLEILTPRTLLMGFTTYVCYLTLLGEERSTNHPVNAYRRCQS